MVMLSIPDVRKGQPGCPGLCPAHSQVILPAHPELSSSWSPLTLFSLYGNIPKLLLVSVSCAEH